MSMIAEQQKKRHVYIIGGFELELYQNNKKLESILRLDTWNISQGWETINIKTSYVQACQYGIAPLKSGDLLLLGGVTHDDNVINDVRMMRFQQKLFDGEMHPFPSEAFNLTQPEDVENTGLRLG